MGGWFSVASLCKRRRGRKCGCAGDQVLADTSNLHFMRPRRGVETFVMVLQSAATSALDSAFRSLFCVRQGIDSGR